jgi:uncharacterized protein YciI
VTAHWILLYDYVPDYLERRGAIRGEHFAHATAYKDRGELLMAGAFTDPADGAVLVFRSDDESVPRSFAENDPYLKHGLITSWTVRRWKHVVGTVEGAEPA